MGFVKDNEKTIFSTVSFIFCITFIISMIMLGYWVTTENHINNSEYGQLNLTGTTYIDIKKETCVETSISSFVCCVSFKSYMIGWCPIIDFNHFCVPMDESHKKGSMCIYSSMS